MCKVFEDCKERDDDGYVREHRRPFPSKCQTIAHNNMPVNVITYAFTTGFVFELMV